MSAESEEDAGGAVADSMMRGEDGRIFTHGTSVTALRHRIRAGSAALKMRLLVIDEIHSLLAGSYREQRILLNSISFLANDLRLPSVCAASHEAKQAL
jgi:hypothetical protein